MAEEVNNTENTENGNVQQETNTGAANTEPEKKYSEEEMNGISKKNSEKAVAKVLRELGITDRVKAKEILLNELKQYNDDLLDKQRVLAISKSDMLDEELVAEIEKLLPTDIPHLFISSVSGMGITELKDMLWEELMKDENRHMTISHKPMDLTMIDDDDEEESELTDDEFEFE